MTGSDPYLGFLNLNQVECKSKYWENYLGALSLNHLLLRLFVLKFQASEGLKSNAKADESNFC